MNPQRWLTFALAAVLIALIAWWTAADTWALRAIMLAPVVRLTFIFQSRGRDPAAFLRALRTFAIMLAVAALIALVQHQAFAQLLAGHIRPAELIFTAWFYAGCLVGLECLDLLIRRLTDRIKQRAVVTPLRLVAIVLLALPLAMATLQTFRIKVGYTLSPLTQRHDPVEFNTRTADGLNIHGYFFNQNHPTTLIIAHGLGAHAENFSTYATALLRKHPINTLIVDLRGHGYSDGHTTSFGYHETADLLAAVDWLQRQHPQASEHLIFYGFSMGSAAAARAASQIPQTVGLIVDSGFARLTDMAWMLAENLPPGLGHFTYGVALPAASLLSEAPLWRVAPVQTITQLDVPVYALHGDNDMQIPAEQGRRLMDLPDVEGRMIPGGRHTNLPDADSTYFQQLGGFIDRLIAGVSDDATPAPTTPAPTSPR